MAEDHRSLAEEVAQGILLDDPGIFKEIVESVLQELLEVEMTEHVGAAPYERSERRTGHRNGYKPRALRTRAPSQRGCSRVTREMRRAGVTWTCGSSMSTAAKSGKRRRWCSWDGR